MNEYAAHVNPSVAIAKVVVDERVAGFAVPILMTRGAADDLHIRKVECTPLSFLFGRHANTRRSAGQKRTALADSIGVADQIASTATECGMVR
jgi:hypothetical protein